MYVLGYVLVNVFVYLNKVYFSVVFFCNIKLQLVYSVKLVKSVGFIKNRISINVEIINRIRNLFLWFGEDMKRDNIKL